MQNCWTWIGFMILCVAAALDFLAIFDGWFVVYPDKTLSLVKGEPFRDVAKDQSDKGLASLTDEQIIDYALKFAERDGVRNALRKMAVGLVQETVNSAVNQVKGAVEGVVNGVLGGIFPRRLAAFNPVALAIAIARDLAGERWQLMNLLARHTNNRAVGFIFMSTLAVVLISLVCVYFGTRRNASKERSSALMALVAWCLWHGVAFRILGIMMFPVGLTNFYGMDNGIKFALAALVVHILGAIVVLCGLWSHRSRHSESADQKAADYRGTKSGIQSRSLSGMRQGNPSGTQSRSLSGVRQGTPSNIEGSKLSGMRQASLSSRNYRGLR